MSQKDDLMITSSEFSKAEAVLVLAECKLLEATIITLRDKAVRTLNKPHLKLVEVKDDRENSK